MKRLILAASLILTAAIGYCDVWRSSNTFTVDTAKSLCGTATTTRAIIHGVCVNTAGGSGSISLFNGQATTTTPFAVIVASAAAGNCLYYDVALSSGLTYSNSGVNNISITYKCGY